MFKEIKEELNKFCRITCDCSNLLILTLAGFGLASLANLNIPITLVISLVLGAVINLLNLNILRRLHNLLIRSFVYRKVIVRLFRIYLKIRHKLNDSKILELHLSLSNEYLDKYHCQFSGRQINKLLDKDNKLMIGLDLGLEEIKLAPIYIALNLNKNNVVLATLVCFYCTLLAMILMVMFGPYAILAHIFVLMFLIFNYFSWVISQDKIYSRIFQNKTKLKDFLYLNAFDDFYLK